MLLDTRLPSHPPPSMKPHFQRIRKFTIYARVIAPVLMFISFLLYAKFGFVASILANIPGLAILMMFPTERLDNTENYTSEQPLTSWIAVASGTLFAFWISDMPWFSTFVEQLFARESLLDWRLVSAVFLACLNWSYLMILKARSLSDTEIVSFYESEDTQHNERDVRKTD